MGKGQPHNSYIGSELALFSNARNWKNYWSKKLKPLIDGRVLEVGAGIGSNMSLLRSNQPWTALEPDIEQAEIIRKMYSSESEAGIKVVTGTLSEIDPSDRYDTILYIDVLEHIEQDQLEVENAYRLLSPSGCLIVLSPAHQSLFSPFDESIGHWRRYNKTMLSELTPAGAEVEKLYYLDSIGCLASWANARILSSKMPTARQILFWDRVMIPCSKIIDRLLNFRLGKTVVAVWRKPLAR